MTKFARVKTPKTLPKIIHCFLLKFSDEKYLPARIASEGRKIVKYLSTGLKGSFTMNV